MEASKSTVQNYNIVSSGDIKLDGKAAIVKSSFAQSGTVNEIIDKFEVGPKIDKADAMQYGLYIHKDGNGVPVKGLPFTSMLTVLPAAVHRTGIPLRPSGPPTEPPRL